MKKLSVILSLFATSLLGSAATNSAEEKPTGGHATGMPSQQFSEFRADFESHPIRETTKSSKESSSSSSSPVEPSVFRDSFLAAGTRHQYIAAFSKEEHEQEELYRVLKISRQEAELEEETRKALAESEALALANLKKQEIARLKDQIETLEILLESLQKTQSTLSESLILTIDKKYGHEATDTDQTRAAASLEYDRINKELDGSRAQYDLIWKELSSLRDNHRELKYGVSIRNLSASSEHLPTGIGGPSGLVTNGLSPIPSSALPVSSLVAKDTGVDRL